MYEVTLYDGYRKEQGTLIHSADARPLKVSSGNIANGINVVNTFVSKLNMKNPGYNKITPRKTWVEVMNVKSKKTEFYGYVLRESYDMDSSGMYSKQVTFVEGLNLLSETLQDYGEYHDMTPREFLQVMIDTHNSRTEPHKRFKLGTVTVTNTTDNVYRYLSQEDNTLDSIFDKLVDRLGGEIRARREPDGWYLDWVQEFGEVKENTPIRVGKNLQSASRDLNGEDIATRLFVYGAEIDKEEADVEEGDAYAAKERITIADVNGGKPYIDDPDGITQFGIVQGHVTFNDVNTKSTLLSRGRDYLNNYKQFTDSNTVTALDLSLINQSMDNYEVGNYHPLDNPGFTAVHNIRIVEKKVDIVEPHRSTLTIGDKHYTSSQYQAEMTKSQREISRLRNDLSASNRRVTLLRNGYTEVNQKVENVQQTLVEIDADNLSQELQTINQDLEDIQTSISELPVYDPATYEQDGLMLAEDKQKLDRITVSEMVDLNEHKQKLDLITVLENVDLDALKQKLDLITVIESIDLDALKTTVADLESRVGTLEGDGTI